MVQLKKSVQKIARAVQKQKIDSYIVKKQFEDTSLDFVIADSEAKEWYDSQQKSATLELLGPEFNFIKKITKPNDVIFECGTHHGLTAMLLSKWVGSEGKIITFEINSKNAAIARQNFELNKIDNVIIEEKGLGSKKSTLKIFDKSNASVTPSSLVSLGWLKNFIYGTHEAEIIALDDYAAAQSIVPNFLKIDVEGYECEVLKGASDILRTLPKLEIEIHTEILSRYNTSVEEIFKLIDLERYQTWIQWNDEEEPQHFNLQQAKAIDRRVHLFAIPKD